MCKSIAIRSVFWKDSTSITIKLLFQKSEPLEGPLEFKIDHMHICIFVLLQYLISEKYYMI